MKSIFIVDDDERIEEKRRAMVDRLAGGFRGLVARSGLSVVFLDLLEKIPKINPPVPTYECEESLTIFRTFRIGGMKRKDLLSQARERDEISSQDAELLGQAWQQPTFPAWRCLEMVDTVVFTPHDLALVDEETSKKQIPVTLMEMLDLKRLWLWNEQNKKHLHGSFVSLLPDDGSLYIRRQYRAQPKGDTRIVATPRIIGPKINGLITSYVCYVRCSCDGTKQSIGIRAVSPDTPVLPTTKVIYALYKVVPGLDS